MTTHFFLVALGGLAALAVLVMIYCLMMAAGRDASYIHGGDEEPPLLRNEGLGTDLFSIEDEAIRRRDLSSDIYNAAELVAQYLGHSGVYQDRLVVIEKKPHYLQGLGLLEITLRRTDDDGTAEKVFIATRESGDKHPKCTVFREGLWVEYLFTVLKDSASEQERYYWDSLGDATAKVKDYAVFNDVINFAKAIREEDNKQHIDPRTLTP